MALQTSCTAVAALSAEMPLISPAAHWATVWSSPVACATATAGSVTAAKREARRVERTFMVDLKRREMMSGMLADLCGAAKR
jgi:hypothetical protein